MKQLRTNVWITLCFHDDGALDVSDAVRLLLHLFTGKGELPDPFPECGIDPTVDDLGCQSFALCP